MQVRVQQLKLSLSNPRSGTWNLGPLLPARRGVLQMRYCAAVMRPMLLLLITVLCRWESPRGERGPCSGAQVQHTGVRRSGWQRPGGRG